ncbi:hypothetical protein C8T65DRAFT_735839 [Cerioporus squamosus]|nr:hypothetical protein C8T65DRAFT_735839 [Cerioporus squamosus]
MSSRTSGSSTGSSTSADPSASSSTSSGASSTVTLTPTSSASSSSTTPFFTASATTGDTASTANPDGLGPPSSSLYLFTFLATLFLLLAISSAIIMRGIFLRRRFRRRLEEAIAAGVLLTPSDDGTGGFGGNGGRTPRRKLQRPTLFDVSVLPPWFSTSSPQDGSWDKLMPFAGNIASEKPGQEPAPDATQSTGPPIRGHRPNAVLLLERATYLFPRNRLRRSNAPSRADPSPISQSITAASSTQDVAMSTPAIPLEPQDPLERAAEVRVAVVIAMPNPHRSGYVPPSVDAEMHRPSPGGKGKARGLDGWSEDGVEEEGVPDVVFGTARVPIAELEPPSENALPAPSS